MLTGRCGGRGAPINKMMRETHSSKINGRFPDKRSVRHAHDYRYLNQTARFPLCASAQFTRGRTAGVYRDVGALLAAPGLLRPATLNRGAASSAPTTNRWKYQRPENRACVCTAHATLATASMRRYFPLTSTGAHYFSASKIPRTRRKSIMLAPCDSMVSTESCPAPSTIRTSTARL